MTHTKQVNIPLLLLFRRLLKMIIHPMLMVRGFRIVGKSNLPRRRKPAIIICNHAAFIDSVYMIAAIWPRFTICGAKPKYFKKRILRFIFRTANILRVESEKQFIQDCQMLLRLGDILLIYPEMGRNAAGMGPFKDWAAKVALQAEVPVIPCYLYGTTDGEEGSIRLFVGEEWMPAGKPDSVTEEFRKAIEHLRREEV